MDLSSLAEGVDLEALAEGVDLEAMAEGKPIRGEVRNNLSVFEASSSATSPM